MFNSIKKRAGKFFADCFAFGLQEYLSRQNESAETLYQMRKGNVDAISKQLEVLSPTIPSEGQHEYKGGVFAIDFPEGGEIKDAKVKYFTGFASTGDYGEPKAIRFYVEVIGFEDKGAPIRNWGVGLDKMRSLRGKGGLN